MFLLLRQVFSIQIMTKFITILFLFLGVLATVAQGTDESNLDELIDNILLEDNDVILDLLNSFSDFHFLYVSVNYTNKTYFSGRDIGIDQYNLSPQITYANSHGIYAGLTGIYYSEFYPKWDVTTLFLGYSGTLSKKNLLKYNVGYSRYIYANSEDAILSNAIDIGLAIKTKNRKLGTQITGSYLFGTEQSFQLTSRTYGILNLLKSKNITIRLKPQINVIIAKQTIDISRTVSIGDNYVVRYFQNDVFDLITTQFNIPIQLSYKNLDFELGYTRNFPHPVGDETTLDSNDFFNISLAYLFDL